MPRALALALANPEHPRARTLRRNLALRIEADIALLDALRGDPDIEQDAGEMPEGVFSTIDRFATEEDESSLGSLDGTAQFNGMPQTIWSRGGTDDREEDDERERDEAERGICCPDENLRDAFGPVIGGHA